jgi:phosphatidylglycerophosphate synthase
VERLILIAPMLLGCAFMLGTFAVYSILCAVGRTPQIEGVGRRRFTELFGPFIVRYMLWLIQPVERLFVAGRVSPNTITLMSLAACAGCGVAIAFGHLASAAWLYIFAGIFDILDGRLARATGKQTQAGALFDSVSDRWGELFVFAGLAWYLRTTPWLLAVMLAVAGSMMVSYTRARGEGLGLKTLDGGMMQRAERIAAVSIGTLIAAWFAAAPETIGYAQATLGWSCLLVGGASSFTAVGRWALGYKQLLAREPAAPTPAEVRRVERPAVVEKNPMRITGEHTA